MADPMKKFYNHVLHNVDPGKYEITTDMWGNNGWEVCGVHENGDKLRVFLKREHHVGGL
ncbi:MAG: hypothetical protein K2H46_02700 [Muribaculaceae bacterium]|nr:hypothetical protein [Muribaculaceae bacterium]